MSPKEHKIKWDSNTGSITVSKNGTEERVILMRSGFMEAFFDEIVNIEGKNALVMTLRRLLKDLGAPEEILTKPDFETFKTFEDSYLLPLSPQNGTIPEIFTVNGKMREFTAFGDTTFTIEPLVFLRRFKEVMTEIFTDKGANAILHAVSKKAGMSVGEKAQKDYGWSELDSSLSSMDGILSYIFPLVGWGTTRITTSKDKSGNYLFYAKCWNSYESDDVTASYPVCTIFQRYLEGIGESLIYKLLGQSTESREVKCRAKGDEYCAFAIKQKDNGSPPLDWDVIEPEWKELDKMDLTPNT